MDPRIRIAGRPELLTAARLLHRFNTEFSEPTPPPEALAERLELGSDEGDHATHALYESLGFTNRGGSGGQVSYDYERSLSPPR